MRTTATDSSNAILMIDFLFISTDFQTNETEKKSTVIRNDEQKKESDHQHLLIVSIKSLFWKTLSYLFCVAVASTAQLRATLRRLPWRQ